MYPLFTLELVCVSLLYLVAWQVSSGFLQQKGAQTSGWAPLPKHHPQGLPLQESISIKVCQRVPLSSSGFLPFKPSNLS